LQALRLQERFNSFVQFSDHNLSQTLLHNAIPLASSPRRLCRLKLLGWSGTNAALVNFIFKNAVSG
jgi:hypothetical protein